MEEIKECLPVVLCEMEIWQKVEGMQTMVWNQSYKSGEKEFQCKLVTGKIAPERIDKRICAVFDQSPSGRYKIRFEYTAFLKQDNPLIDDIKYAEKEFTIKEKTAVDPRCTQKVALYISHFFIMYGALLIWVWIYDYIAFCLQTIAIKTNTENGWLAWIPIANLYLVCKIAGRPS